MTTEQPADSEAARELALYAVNDSATYRQTTQAVLANLARKIKRGTYRADLAPKIWRYVANAAAKHYTQEFDAQDAGTYGCFTPATRDLAAVEIAENYAEQLAEAAA